jgi:diguanylate cyclase
VRLVGAPERRRPNVDLPSAPTALGALLGGLGFLLIGYVIWLAVEPHYHYSPVIDGWMVDGFEMLVALLCGARALLRRPGRGAALALGIGLLSWSVGDIIFTIQTLSKASSYGPTWSDLFWLGFYPLAYTGVVLFMRREVRRIADPSWLDGVVAGFGAASVCAAFAFAGLHLTGTGALSATTKLAYPLGDLLLFALVVGGATLLSGRKSAPWALLAAAMALNAVGDTFNLFQSSLGTPRADAVFRALAWPAAGLLVCVAVWLRPRSRDFLATRRPTGFALPGTAATAALGVLFVGTLHRVTGVALALAAATMVAVGVRATLSARRLRELTIKRFEQSLTDDLTGLRNRRYLMEVLDSVFADQADRLTADGRLAFLYIDLDRFKVINDSFGHAAGDELLKQLGPRLSMVLRHGEVLVRLGGDEFGVLLIGANAEDAAAVARRLIDDIEGPFDLEGLQARVSASVGIAYGPGQRRRCAGTRPVRRRRHVPGQAGGFVIRAV